MLEGFQNFLSSNSVTLNIILTLLLLFQWYKQHAKEQSIKNNLFALKRILRKLPETDATIEVLDATLASLATRPPFVKAFRKTEENIIKKVKKEIEAPIKH